MSNTANTPAKPTRRVRAGHPPQQPATPLAHTRRVDTAQMQGNHAHVVNGNTGPQQAQAGRVAVPPHWHSEQAPAHRLMPQIVDELSEGQLLAVSAGLVVSIFGLVAIVLWAVGIA